jgi:hypothetical protein
MDMIIHGVIRKIVLPATTCTVVSPNWKQILRCYHTYISDATGSKAAIDLTFVDPRSALLYIWKVGTDSWNSDHYPISMEYNGIIESCKCSKKASGLHNKKPIGQPL